MKRVLVLLCLCLTAALWPMHAQISQPVSFPLITTGAADGKIPIGKTSDTSLNLATITAGTGVSVTNGAGSITVAANNGHGTVGPSNPSGTSSATAVMMGLAGSITVKGVDMLLCSGGSGTNNVGTTTVLMKYGTSTAPSNGAAVTGTSAGSTFNLGTSGNLPFGGCFLVTGLTATTTYWFDVAVTAVGGGTATLSSVTMTALDVP